MASQKKKIAQQDARDGIKVAADLTDCFFTVLNRSTAGFSADCVVAETVKRGLDQAYVLRRLPTLFLILKGRRLIAKTPRYVTSSRNSSPLPIWEKVENAKEPQN